MRPELFRMEDVTAGEPGREPLSDFTLVLRGGEIVGVFSMHAEVKDALSGIMSGKMPTTRGRFYWRNEANPIEEIDPRRPRKVGVVRPVKTLIDDLSVAENIFVIRPGVKGRFIDTPLIKRQTRQLLSEFGLAVEPGVLARDLGELERCNVEVVKNVALGAEVVVLQDLSTFLSDAEVDQLMQLVVRIAATGIGFVLVDGAVAPLERYADRVIVIKNGKNFWAFEHGQLDAAAIRSCFSWESSVPHPALTHGVPPPANAPPALAFSTVVAGALRGLIFRLHAGDELCLYDEEGPMLQAVRALLAGEVSPSAGSIAVDGRPFNARNLREALDQRVAFVPENPAATMLFPDFTAVENLAFAASRKTATFWAAPAYLASCLREYAPFFEPGELDKYPDQLSPAALLKLVYCRWHLYRPGVVVCVKPFSSIDRSLEETSAFFIRLLRAKGVAILGLTSSASEADLFERKIVLNPKNVSLHLKNDL